MLSDLLQSVARCVFILLLQMMFIEVAEELFLLFLLHLLESLTSLILALELLHYDLRCAPLPLIVEQFSIILVHHLLIQVIIV